MHIGIMLWNIPTHTPISTRPFARSCTLQMLFSRATRSAVAVRCLCERLQTNGSMHSMQTWLRAVKHTRKEKRINVLMLFVRWVLFRFFFLLLLRSLLVVLFSFSLFLLSLARVFICYVHSFISWSAIVHDAKMQLHIVCKIASVWMAKKTEAFIFSTSEILSVHNEKCKMRREKKSGEWK